VREGLPHLFEVAAPHRVLLHDGHQLRELDGAAVVLESIRWISFGRNS
jgi:hypothetical protein